MQYLCVCSGSLFYVFVMGSLKGRSIRWYYQAAKLHVVKPSEAPFVSLRHTREELIMEGGVMSG